MKYYSTFDNATLETLEGLKEENLLKNVIIMPDGHKAGKNCIVGMTGNMEIDDDFINPDWIGADMGCGITVAQFKKQEIDFPELANFIKENFIKNSEAYKKSLEKCSINYLQTDFSGVHFLESYGTLGGGNHFIEIDEDENYYYLIVHSGSRGYGGKVYKELKIKQNSKRKEIKNLILRNKIEVIKNNYEKKYWNNRIKEIDFSFETLTDSMKELIRNEYKYYNDLYLYYMERTEFFAVRSREYIVDEILIHIKAKIISFDYGNYTHNKVEQNRKDKKIYVYKGAQPLQNDGLTYIPINMAEGTLKCVLEKSPEWNFSAPHGAGRILSRSEAKKTLNVEDFKTLTKDIYSENVNEQTLDESPEAYKNLSYILSALQPIMIGYSVLNPIFNYKNSN